MSTAEDLYPSRNGASAMLVERQDPVVYSPACRQAPIDSALIESYEKNGFLLLEGLFSNEEVDLFRREVQRLRSDPLIAKRDEAISEPDSGEIRSIFKVQALSPIFKKLASDRRLAGLAQFILNDEIYIHQSRVNYKPGFKGREFFWHSDFETWHVEDGMPRMRALSVSILLTDNYGYNGPLMLVPGSHKAYAVCSGETPRDHYHQSLRRQELGVPDSVIMERLVDRGGIVTATARAGSVIVFDCNTMHGSNSNISPQPRSNVFFVYNSLSNRIGSPFCQQPPRPEFIASRRRIDLVEPGDWSANDYAY